MKLCACGSGQTYANCCEPYIMEKKQTETTEKLLRSRYTAHVLKNVNYILKTVHLEKVADHDANTIKEWCEQTKWQKLEILNQEFGQIEDDIGYIEFKAYYINLDGKSEQHHEKSEFRKKNGIWYFYTGSYPKKPNQNTGPKIGRNEPCTCGSGKKYKKCCG